VVAINAGCALEDQQDVHHGALPYAEVAAFLSQLRSQRSVGARALEFLILVAARSGECSARAG
jgi:hypothetical protein